MHRLVCICAILTLLLANSGIPASGQSNLQSDIPIAALLTSGSVGTSLLPDSEATGTFELSRCCKVCTQGKACGNTCIAAWMQCNVGPGCACDG